MDFAVVKRPFLTKSSCLLPRLDLCRRKPLPLSLWFRCPLPCNISKVSIVRYAKKRNSAVEQSAKKQSTIGKEELVGDDGYDVEDGEPDEELQEEDVEDFADDIVMDDDSEHFEDDFESDDTNLSVGDGSGGGGISLAGTWWDKEALSIAEDVSMSFNGDLKIYAFKTSANSSIRIRIEKLSTKYGSPTVSDIEAFSSAYRARLDEAEHAGTIPNNISLEVSSPGVERVIRVPDELERFQDLPMYVKYFTDGATASSPQEREGIFKLISFDTDLCHCTWGIADVKRNREQGGKGRPLNKKQREWRLQTPFDSLHLVRLHSDC